MLMTVNQRVLGSSLSGLVTRAAYRLREQKSCLYTGVRLLQVRLGRLIGMERTRLEIKLEQPLFLF